MGEELCGKSILEISIGGEENFLVTDYDYFIGCPCGRP